MKKITLALLILFPIYSFTQELEGYNQSCDWYIKAVQTQDLEERLQIVKDNFQEFESFDVNDPCRVLYCLSVKEKYYVLSRDSSVGFVYPKKMINISKFNEIDTVLLLNSKATKVLYGDNIKGVVLISSDSDDYEKRIANLWKQK